MLKRQGFIFFPKKGNTFRFLLLILQFVILRTEMKTEPTTYNLLNSISVFFFKQKTAYEISACLVGSEMCIRDRY